jgi:hypothetical protein
MTPWTPGAPAQVRVGLGHSNVVVTVAMLAFLGIVVGVAAYGAATADDSSARVLGFGIAGLFAIPLVMLLFALPPVVPIAQAIDQGARAFQPQRRLGWYPRPWSG